MIRPTIAELVAKTKTPPAEISFDLFASLLISGIAKLTTILGCGIKAFSTNNQSKITYTYNPFPSFNL